MKLENRTGQVPSPGEGPEETPSADSKKPVIVYILILFIVAFLLMALSLLMHQHSNTEALGRLNESIAAMKEAQDTQERIAELENELEEANAAARQFQDANETSRNQASHAQHILEQTREAMDCFWQLDEAYVLENTDQCAELLAKMVQNTEDPLWEYLSPQAAEKYAEILAALRGGEEAAG